MLYARGEFQHKLLPVITGEAVVTINYEARPAEDGRDLLMADISSQLKIDGPFGDLVVKLASSLAVEKAEKESRRLVHIFAAVLQGHRREARRAVREPARASRRSPARAGAVPGPPEAALGRPYVKASAVTSRAPAGASHARSSPTASARSRCPRASTGARRPSAP